MYKINFILITAILLSACEETQTTRTNVSTIDIHHFWDAYDKIVDTDDSLQQVQWLDSLFLSKATVGQQAMIVARRYTVDDYLYAINNYPKFWTSVRDNTLKAKNHAEALQENINKIKTIYPDLKPAKIYFTMGALRSNGTTMDSMVLIGTELAMGDSTTVSEELIERHSHLPDFFASNPSENIVFLNTHEYLHTQQSTTIGNTLLAQTVLEGAAEFLAEKALNVDSPNPQISYGKRNDEAIKTAFVKEMFSPNLYNWIWNSKNNAFGMRDLAYYVGYAICKRYYNRSEDKAKAIKEMLELEYNDINRLNSFVDTSGYFDEPVAHYRTVFEASRPMVENMVGFKNGSLDVDPKLERIRIQFSEPMDTRRISTDLGLLGREAFPKITKAEFSEDALYLDYHVQLDSNKNYEFVVHWNMRNKEGIPLKPYTVKFKTQ